MFLHRLISLVAFSCTPLCQSSLIARSVVCYVQVINSCFIVLSYATGHGEVVDLTILHYDRSAAVTCVSKKLN